CQQYSTWNTF
nr:immunoglobulin light chain junction region [Macaca mulatta]